MKTIWNKGLTAKQKEEMKAHFESSALLRERLKKMLFDKTESARKANRTASSYDNPNWALTQADAIGYERALFEVISLLD